MSDVKFRATVKHDGAEVGDLPWLEEFWAVRYGDYSALQDRIEELQDRIEELEVKLAKAVVALHEIAGKKDFADDPWSIARTIIAELKEGELND